MGEPGFLLEGGARALLLYTGVRSRAELDPGMTLGWRHMAAAMALRCGMRQVRATRGWAVRAAWAAAVAAGLLGGCAEERDPNRPLTVDEGAALLRDVRDDRSRLDTLTPAERAYLVKTLKR